MLVRQYELHTDTAILVCWLEAKRLKVGYRVKLKNSESPEVWWTVKKEFNEMNLADVKGGQQSYKWHEKDFHGKLKGLNIQPL